MVLRASSLDALDPNLQRVDEEDDEHAVEPAVSRTNPFSWLLMPFVATWDGMGWFFGTALPKVARRIREALTPFAIRLRELLVTIREKISELVAPVLRPFAWTYDTIAGLYHRAADGMRPAVDKAYAAPIAFGKWWQVLRARVLARLRSAQAWLVDLAVWKGTKAALRQLRGSARNAVRTVIQPVRNQIAAIRNRRS